MKRSCRVRGGTAWVPTGDGSGHFNDSVLVYADTMDVGYLMGMYRDTNRLFHSR